MYFYYRNNFIKIFSIFLLFCYNSIFSISFSQEEPIHDGIMLYNVVLRMFVWHNAI